MRKISSVIAVASAGVAALAMAPPANAAEGWERCPDGWTCLFENYDGTGRIAMFQWGVDDIGQWNAAFNDQASAIWNRNNRYACLAEHSRGQGWGRTLQFKPRGDKYYLGRWDFNDKASGLFTKSTPIFCGEDTGV